MGRMYEEPTFAVFNDKGSCLVSTITRSPHTSLSMYRRMYKKAWEEAKREGYRIAEVLIDEGRESEV